MSSSSKVIKKKITTAKERGEKILNILNTKKGTADVAEFTSTIKFVLTVLDDFLKTKSKERPNIPTEADQLDQLTNEYITLLNQLVDTGRFLRCFTSNRVRKRIEHINTQIYRESSQIYLGLQEKRKSSKKSSSSKDKKGSVSYAAELQSLTDCFKDDEAKLLWETAFEQSLMVSWETFISVLQRTLPIDATSSKQLQYILDNSNTGYVSMFRFSDFLNGFGPLRQCLDKVQGVLSAEWFHGFLSSLEAERLLERHPAGTFLIRFSKSKPGSFAIAYVDANQRNAITHTLISCCPPSGFKIEEAYNRNARGRLFATLQEVVEFYNYLLKTSFRSELSRLSWFHGDLTSEEAQEILANSPDGTYLLRFSAKGGYLAISYVHSKEVRHGLIECLANGYKYDNRPNVFTTLNDVVGNLGELLKTPFTTLTYEVTRTKGAFGSLGQPGSPGQPPQATAPMDPTGNSTYADFSKILGNGAAPMMPGSPSTQRPGAAPGQYGVMPGGSTPTRGDSNGSINTQYGGMPIAESLPNSPPTAAAAPTQAQRMYGNIMPSQYQSIPGQPPVSPTGARLSTPPTPSPAVGTPPNATSGVVPASLGGGGLGAAPNNSQYGSIALPPSMLGMRPQSVASPLSPQQQQQHPSFQPQYGSIPSPGNSPNNSGGSTVLPPGAHVTPSQYGSIPSPGASPNNSGGSFIPGGLRNSGGVSGIPSSALGGSPSQYGSIPSPMAPRANSPVLGSSPSGSGGQYGSIPSPMGTNSPSGSGGQYGSISSPALAHRPPISSPLRTSHDLSSVATPAPTAAPISSNNYGQIPNPATLGGIGATPASSQYGSIPSPVTTRINTPISRTSSGTGFGLGNNSNSNNSSGGSIGGGTANYGQIPNPGSPRTLTHAPSSSGGGQPLSAPVTPTKPAPSADRNYGDIPQNLNLRIKAAMASPSLSNSGNLPGSGSGNLSGGLPPSSPTPAPAAQAPSNYGQIPSAMMKRLPNSPSKGPGQPLASPVASPAPASPSNYGQIPSGLVRRSNNFGSPAFGRPASPLGGGAPPSEYGGLGSVSEYGGLNGAALKPNTAVSPQGSFSEYGGLNGLSSSTNGNSGLPSNSSHSEYGGLNEVNKRFSAIQPPSAASNNNTQYSEYGGLSFGNQPQQQYQKDSSSVSEYGGMPSGSSISEYGGMPSGSSVSEYGGMPSGSSMSEYGGMPSGTSMSEYGGMPSSSEYGGMPSGSEYGGMPGGSVSEYGGMPDLSSKPTGFTPGQSPLARSGSNLVSQHRGVNK